MEAKLKPYPGYHESRHPWLTSIPLHWGERRAKFYFRELDERSQTGREELLSVSHLTGVTPRSEKNITMFKAESYVGHKLCRPGDLVINTMWAWMGALGNASSIGIISSSYGVYRPTSSDFFVPEYLDHLLRTRAYVSEYLCRSTGIRSSRLRLYPDQFLDISILQPPLEEQRRIVSYLKAKNTHIRCLIRAKKRLIALLNEQKQAIIQRAVTGGLDPNVPRKPSGVDWLGEVPAHWNRISLRHLGTKFGSGVTPRGGASVYTTSGVLFLRSQNVHFEGLHLEDVARIPEYVHETMSGSHVHPHDVLINITGASIGRVCAVPENMGPANVNQHVCIIRPRKVQVLPEYLASFLSCRFIQDEIRVSQEGASREGLTLKALKALPVLIPPLDEQDRINGAIEEQTSEVQKAILVANHEIDLIREYRTRLIADVVTGKLDVRGVVLPDAGDGEDWNGAVKEDLEPLDALTAEEV